MRYSRHNQTKHAKNKHFQIRIRDWMIDSQKQRNTSEKAKGVLLPSFRIYYLPMIIRIIGVIGLCKL